jgi:hypothetical protein
MEKQAISLHGGSRNIFVGGIRVVSSNSSTSSLDNARENSFTVGLVAVQTDAMAPFHSQIFYLNNLKVFIM